MTSEVSEIADHIYRLSTFVPTAGPAGFTFNQFLVDAEEPFLLHCGQPALFPSVAPAARRVLDLAGLRWIGFSHVEADECGALEPWLAAAPQAQPTHNRLGCTLRLNDLSPRPPVARKDATCSTSAAAAYDGSTRPICPTIGKPRCCSRR